MRVIKVLLVHLIFVAIFFLVLDRVAAVLLVDPALSRPRLVDSFERTLATWPLRADPVTGWALAPPPEKPPELRKGYQLSHTGIGLRWVPGTMDMGPPLVLLVLGDEAAFGANVRLEDTFGAWVKRSMEEHLADRTIAVANAAVPGYDALQMYLQFRLLAPVRPHLVLCCFTGHTVFPTEAPRRPIDMRRSLLKEFFYRPALTRTLFLAIDRVIGGEEVTGVGWQPRPETAQEPDAEEFGRIVETIIAHGDRHRIPLLMMSLGLPEPCRGVLERACAQERVAYVDGDQALVDHTQLQGAQGAGLASEAAQDALVLGTLDRTNEALSWWFQRHLRPHVVPVFLSRLYFSPALLPTRLAHRVLGEALTMAVIEGDLFSWRHRVLR